MHTVSRHIKPSLSMHFLSAHCIKTHQVLLKHPNYNQSDSLHKLNRPEQVILLRLRTGHNRLNAHMYNKFKVGESEMCPCNADITTAEHLLQHCRLHDAVRWDVRPEPTLLRDKLYGNPEELRRTAAFVRTTGISIQYTTKKKKNHCLSHHDIQWGHFTGGLFVWMISAASVFSSKYEGIFQRWTTVMTKISPLPEWPGKKGHFLQQGCSRTEYRDQNSSLVMCWACCPAWCSVMGSILLWGELSGRGEFSLEVNMGSDSISPKHSDKSINRGLVSSHMHSTTWTQNPDIHVLDGQMLATKTHLACTYMRWNVTTLIVGLKTYVKISPRMVNSRDIAGNVEKEEVKIALLAFDHAASVISDMTIWQPHLTTGLFSWPISLFYQSCSATVELWPSLSFVI